MKKVMGCGGAGGGAGCCAKAKEEASRNHKVDPAASRAAIIRASLERFPAFARRPQGSERSAGTQDRRGSVGFALAGPARDRVRQPKGYPRIAPIAGPRRQAKICQSYMSFVSDMTSDHECQPKPRQFCIDYIQ